VVGSVLLRLEIGVAFRLRGRRGPPAHQPSRKCQQRRRKPNPQEFSLKNFKAAMGEESPGADRRHVNRPPRKKVTVIIERGEEGDSQAAVRHGIEETVAGSRQKEVGQHGKPSKPRQGLPEPYENHSARQEGGQYQGMPESAVAPEVTVTDAESKSDYIKVGNHGACRAHQPDTFWRARAVEAGAYGEAGDCM
jgi:hypothetical protein